MTLTRRAALSLAIVALAACRQQTASVEPAPAAPEETVRQFLAAVNARDFNRMGLLWGTERGPSTVTSPNSPEVRRQQLEIMQRLLLSDSHRVAGTEPVPGDAAKQRLLVEITRGPRRATVPFTMVNARTGGWLIWEVGINEAMPLARPGT